MKHFYAVDRNNEMRDIIRTSDGSKFIDEWVGTPVSDFCNMGIDPKTQEFNPLFIYSVRAIEGNSNKYNSRLILIANPEAEMSSSSGSMILPTPSIPENYKEIVFQPIFIGEIVNVNFFYSTHSFGSSGAGSQDIDLVPMFKLIFDSAMGTIDCTELIEDYDPNSPLFINQSFKPSTSQIQLNVITVPSRSIDNLNHPIEFPAKVAKLITISVDSSGTTLAWNVSSISTGSGFGTFTANTYGLPPTYCIRDTYSVDTQKSIEELAEVIAGIQAYVDTSISAVNARLNAASENYITR